MGLVRILLPLPRAAARLSPEKGGPLLGAALLHCVMPSWVLLWIPSAARRLAWAEEAVAVYGFLPRQTDGGSRAPAPPALPPPLHLPRPGAGPAAGAAPAPPA